MSQVHDEWKQQRAKSVTKHDLPAWWASALINSDSSGLSREPDGLAEFQEWAGQNHHLLNPVSCDSEAFIGRWNGRMCELLTYTYLEG